MTNASGGLNPEYAVGDITLLNDVCASYECGTRSYESISTFF